MKTVGILSAGVKVQQKAYDGCERSAEDAHFSMTPDPNLKRSVCSAPFMLFFFWTFDLENCSLSQHFFYNNECTSVQAGNMLNFLEIYILI